MMKILFFTLIAILILFLSYLSFTEEKTIIQSPHSLQDLKANKLETSQKSTPENVSMPSDLPDRKENSNNSDKLMPNQDIIVKSVDIHRDDYKIPGEDLQNVSIETIQNDSTLTNEEKENRIADKAYYDVTTTQSPIVKVNHNQLMKMIEEDENLHLNK